MAETAHVGGRRGLGRVLGEMHYRLRTEGEGPARKALAIWLGTVVGCLPLYGTHLLLSVTLGRALGLSRVTTYLAAHINNPLTAPWLLYLSFGMGRWLFEGRWPTLSMEQLRSLTLWSFGRDLLVGSLVLGFGIGAVLAGVAYAVGARRSRPTAARRLWEATSRRYLASGVLHWEFVRGKLLRDPVYRALLSGGLLPGEGRLLDLGCGRGIVPALVETAREQHAAGCWEPGWPAPPDALSVVGVERNPGLAAVARGASGARILTADLHDHVPEPSDAVLLLDVLHYLAAERQERLLRLACDALRPGGCLIVREADAGAGPRFWWTRIAERACSLLRLDWRQRFAYRGSAEWCALLGSHGLRTSVLPMWEGTPFGNVLIVARRPDASRSAP